MVKDINHYIDNLVTYYKKNGIENPPIEIDPDPDQDYQGEIPIIFVSDYDPIWIAAYNASTREFNIDEPELERSIKLYHHDEREDEDY
jgi:hypothetical protein